MEDLSLLGIDSWAYHQSHLGIIITDSSLKVLFINRWFEDYQIVRISKAKESPLYSVFPGIIENRARIAIETALKGQPSVLSNKLHKYIIPVPLAENQYPGLDFMQQSVTVSPRIINGKKDGIMIIIEDVTERVAREMELLRQIDESQLAHQRLNELSDLNRILLETLPFPMDIIDENGHILFFNSKMDLIMPGNHIGRKCWDVYRDDHTPCPQCPAESEIMLGEITISETHQILGDKVFQVSQTGMMYKGKKALLEVYMDITERKKSEEINRRNAVMFSNLNEVSNEILQLPDLNSIYQYICASLHKRFPRTIIAYLSINEARNESEIAEVIGLENSMLMKLKQISKFDFKNKKFKLVPKISQFLQSGSFTEIKGNISDFSFGEFSPKIAKEVYKVLNNNKIYSIGVIRNNELLGAINFLTYKNEDISDIDYIELFVKQAGLLIQNKMMQIELLESEKKFRTIFEKSPIGISLGNAYSGHNYIINERFAQIAGRTIAEMYKINWMHITHPDDLQDDLDNMARLNAGEINGFTMNKRYIKPDGSIVWINLIVVKLQYDEHKDPQYLTMIEDITEEKQTQLQLENYAMELKKNNAEKDKFFSIIAHDLRGPFSGLLGLTEVLHEYLDSMSYEDIKELIISLKNSVTNSYALLENLLEWSRVQRGMINFSPEYFILKQLQLEVFESVAEMAVNKNITISVIVNEEQMIYADRYMLGTILRNLMSNAIKFTQYGGKVHFIIEKENRGQTKFIVKDNGIGMNSEILENLFRLDVNTCRPGTNNEPSSGLGLLLCKEFVEKHKGTLWAESEIDRGSTFYFVI